MTGLISVSNLEKKGLQLTVPNNSPSELQLFCHKDRRCIGLFNISKEYPCNCRTLNLFVLSSKTWCNLCCYNGVLKFNCNSLRLALKIANFGLEQETLFIYKLKEKNTPYEEFLMTYRNFISSAYKRSYKTHPLIRISTLQLLSAKVLILRTNYIYLNKHKHELFIVKNFLLTELRENFLKSCFEDFLKLLSIPKIYFDFIKKSLFYEWLVHELKKLILVNNEVCFLKLDEALTLLLLSKKQDIALKKNMVDYNNIL